MFKRSLVHLQQVAAATASSSSSSPSSPVFDITIIGAGLVGSTLAKSLECSPLTKHLKVALIDRPNHFSKFSSYRFRCDEPGLRCTALNATSIQLLRQIQVWPLVQSATQYNSMKVWDRNNTLIQFDSTASTTASATSAATTAMLGSMIENDDLLNQVWNQLQHVEKLNVDQVTRLERDEHAPIVKIHLNRHNSSDGASSAVIKTRMVVGCDGQESIVRKTGNFSGVSYRYPVRSFVCSVECDRAVPVAMQKFAAEGVLALLPMYSTSNKNVYNIVFTTSAERALEMGKMSEEQIIAMFNKIWNANDLNILRLNNPQKGSFPLTRSHVDQYHSWEGRLFVMGDAAHSMLPIAGQGLNAGMYDITEFIACLQNSLETGHDITNFSTMNKEWWWRNESMVRGVEHVRGMYGVGEVLSQHHLAGTVLDKVRGLGLNLLNMRNPLSDRIRQELVSVALGNYASTSHIGPDGIIRQDLPAQFA